MASTITLQSSISYAQAFVKGRPLAGVGGVAGEPSVSIANTIMGFMFSPPFAWRWNRDVATTTTSPGQQDYSIAIPNFGWMEKATISNGSGTWELTLAEVLADSTQQGRPDKVAAQLDDGAGNITFRLMDVPDGTYTLTVIYQQKVTLLTDITSTWAPVPDELAHIFNTAFLAKAYEQADDQRYALQWSLFVKMLIANSEGAKDADKNLFLDNVLKDERQRTSEMLGAQSGRQSRGL